MSIRTGISVAVVLLLVALVSALPDRGHKTERGETRGQTTERGEIRGKVTDTNGAPLPGVTVTLSRIDTRPATTDQRGEYAFSNLPPGNYQVRFRLAGFKLLVRPVVVGASRATQLNARLESEPAQSISILQMDHVRPAERQMQVASPLGAPAAAVAGDYEPRMRYAGPFNTEAYDSLEENPFRRVAADALSTFSIDVDTASYANVRRFLNGGRLPPPGAVRIEELVNYFHFDYAQPKSDAPFSITTEFAACPWSPKHRLALIGLQGRALQEQDNKPRNLVFLIDVSGSMMDPDKLPLVRTALRMLAGTLDAEDRVAIVVYAGASGLVLPSTPGDRKSTIDRAIADLEAGGSTNGGEGIKLAYEVAREHFIRDGINRVVLATDGDFNVGVTSQDELVRLIEQERSSGIFLSVLGVGTGNLKDSTMEKLADKGNGNYAYLDTLHEARRVLVAEAGATLVTIAKDVKIQVEFNPKAVAAYRLIGYENRVLRNEDFNDDRKDAGEIGAGHSVTALYEIVPVGVDVDTPSIDPLKYQKGTELTPQASSDELITVKLRYKAPDSDTSNLLSTVVYNRPAALSANLGFASAVAEFGMLLRDSKHAGSGSFSSAIERARSFRGQDADGYRAELIKLVELAASLKRIPTSSDARK